MGNPSHVHAEQSVLGGLMLDNSAWDLVNGMLKVIDFTQDQHRLIYQAISTLVGQGKPVDLITLSEHLERQGQLDGVGGLKYLGRLASDTPGTSNIRSYAEVVSDKSKRRKLRELFSLGVEKIDTADLQLLTGDILSKAEVIAASDTAASLSFSEAFSRTLAYIDEASEARGRGGTVGVPTGLPALDRKIGGLQKKRLIILAARPSIGKTALANQISLFAARKGFPVGICSLEMGAEELMIRSLANTYGLNVSGLSFGDDKELTKLTHAMGQRPITDLPIYLDTDTYSLGGIVSRLSEWKRKHGIALGVVDHIGLIEGDGKKSRNDWLGTVSRTLKVTAKRLDIPILAVSQLNRSVEKEKRWPVLADLRDSGSVEQDADACIFLHVEGDAQLTPKGLPIEIGLLKNRMGRRDWLPEQFVFDGRTQRINEQIR